MQYTKTFRIVSFVVLFTCFSCLKALAIDDDGGIGDDVPIDGGLSLLLAAGVGYGVKKIRRRKGTRKAEQC
jgi:hypothetical protein